MLILSWWFFARFKPQVWTCWPTLNTPDTQAILIELSIILSFLRVLWNFVAHKEEIIFSYFIMSEMRKTRDSTNQQHITVLHMRSLGLSWYLFLTVFLFHLLSEKEAVLHEMHSVFPTGHISFLFFPFVNFFLFLQGWLILFFFPWCFGEANSAKSVQGCHVFACSVACALLVYAQAQSSMWTWTR